MNLKQFDPAIYPQLLWVCVENDFKKLNGLFSDIDDDSDLDFGKFENFEAATIRAIDKKLVDMAY